MAIIENRVSEEGDVLVIKTDIPIVGLIGLSQFVDTTVGEDLENYFLKEFRYSLNGGLTFSDWVTLNLTNIELVDISKFDSFVIEYRYMRIGNTPEVDLEFNDILVSGPKEDLPYPVYDKLYFSNFFNVNDIGVFGWALNVLEKIYSKGSILPDFYQRGDNKSNLEDEDFITYWNSLTHLFAIIVYYARQFESISSNNVLLEEFLKSKDLILPKDLNAVDTLYLYQNYINEYKKRGTLSILDQKENGSSIDGELIRLLDHKITEELIFALFQNFESGWCLGKSSPTWKGTEFIKNIRKGYEFQNQVLDLAKYPLIESSFISIVDEKIQISNTLTDGLESGIKFEVGNEDFRLIVDSREDYEISFFIKQSSLRPGIAFGCTFWDVNDNVVNAKKSTEDTISDIFIENYALNKVGEFYWIRGILWNSEKLFEGNQPFDINDKLNIGVGSNLKMNSQTNKIIPTITYTADSTPSTIDIYGVVIRPLKLNFSRGQLGLRNLIYLLTVNNNDQYSESQLKTLIQNKLLPYNCFLKQNYIN